MELSAFKSRSGFALFEVLVGIVVGGMLIASGIGLIGVGLKASTQNKYLQSASFLGTELVAKVTTYAERKWYCVENAPQSPATSGCGIYNLQKGPSNHYFVTSENGILRVVPGDEPNLLVGEVLYTRYFYVENVLRNSATGEIAIDGDVVEDPSTQKVTVVVVWPGGGSIENVKYVTRSNNEVLAQSDWTGAGNDTLIYPATSIPVTFGIKNNIDITTLPGTIKIGS